jgi:hypothetical protein
MPLLNLSGLSAVSCSCSLAINLALYSLLCLFPVKESSTRNSVLLVYRLTILKGSLL